MMKHKIYTISPSWLIKDKKEFADGLMKLKALGFSFTNTKLPSKLLTPKQKAVQLHAAYKDKKTTFILAQRGGYSSMKMLPYVDFELIKRNRKTFAGFSDVSTLLNLIYEKTGQITLHSPMVLNFSNPTPFTVKSFMNAINGFPEKNLFSGAPLKVYNHGKASGTLKGGNLITMTALLSTKWETKTDNSILFIEDVDEKQHEIDRYLTQWILCGKLQKVKAIILGDFRDVENSEVYGVIKSQMKIKVPVVHCPFIGHVKNKITLPVGAKVELDTHKKSLRVLA